MSRQEVNTRVTNGLAIFASHGGPESLKPERIICRSFSSGGMIIFEISDLITLVSFHLSLCYRHLSTAGKIVNNLVEIGILRETTGMKRNQMFVCDEIMRILNSY